MTELQLHACQIYMDNTLYVVATPPGLTVLSIPVYFETNSVSFLMIMCIPLPPDCLHPANFNCFSPRYMYSERAIPSFACLMRIHSGFITRLGNLKTPTPLLSSPLLWPSEIWTLNWSLRDASRYICRRGVHWRRMGWGSIIWYDFFLSYTH